MYVSYYTSQFNDLAYMNADAMGADLTDAFDFVLTDPPYNIRLKKNRQKADHGSLHE